MPKSATAGRELAECTAPARFGEHHYLSKLNYNCDMEKQTSLSFQHPEVGLGGGLHELLLIIATALKASRTQAKLTM